MHSSALEDGRPNRPHEPSTHIPHHPIHHPRIRRVQSMIQGMRERRSHFKQLRRQFLGQSIQPRVKFMQLIISKNPKQKQPTFDSSEPSSPDLLFTVIINAISLLLDSCSKLARSASSSSLPIVAIASPAPAPKIPAPAPPLAPSAPPIAPKKSFLWLFLLNELTFFLSFFKRRVLVFLGRFSSFRCCRSKRAVSSFESNRVGLGFSWVIIGGGNLTCFGHVLLQETHDLLHVDLLLGAGLDRGLGGSGVHAVVCQNGGERQRENCQRY